MGFIAKPLKLIDYVPVGRQDKHLPLLKLTQDNLFLGRLMSTLKAENNMGDVLIFNWPETNTMIDLLYASGYVDKLHSFEDFADDINIFWDLIDCARENFITENGKRNRGVVATCFLFDRLRHSHVFTKRFMDNPHSPYQLLGKKKLLNFLADNNVKRTNFFYLRYACNRFMEFVLPLNNHIINERIIITMSRHRIYEGNAFTSRAIVQGFGDLFMNPEKFHSYADFNGAQLHYTIGQIMDRFVGESNLCRCTMKFLFDVYQDLVTDYPKHDFFVDNNLYSTELVLSGDVANKLAAGFKLVAAGRDEELPAYRKVMFIVDRNEYRTSSGRSVYLRSVDFSHILDDGWRRIMMNYAQHCVLEGNFQYNNVLHVIGDYINENKSSANRYHISKADATEIKTRIVFRNELKTAAKNNYLFLFRHFIRWADRRGYLSVEDGALSKASNVRDRYCPEPHSVQGIDIKKIDDALTQLGNKSKRYLLSREAFHIQLNSETRAGEILSLLTGDIHFLEDGGCLVNHRAKNAGDELNERIFSTIATDHLRKAMEISREERMSCPGEKMRKHIFLYKNEKSSRALYAVMSVNRYNIDIQDACRLAGIKPITSGNVRDTTITGLKKMANEKKLDWRVTNALVGHSKKISANAYYDIDFRDVIKAAKSVILGTITIEED